MIKKTISSIVTIVLLGTTISTHAQIRSNIWQGHINIRGNSMLPWYGSNALSFFGFGNPFYMRWIHPIPEYDFHIPNWSMQQDGEKMQLSGPYWWRCLLSGDFRHDYNFSLGYTLYWRSLKIPFNAQLGLNYEWRGVCIDEGALAGLHKTSYIVPSMGVTWRVLGTEIEREDNMNILLGFTASYVAPMTYNDPLLLGSNAVNGGFRFGVSLGYLGMGLLEDSDIFSDNSGKAKTIISLRYEWDTFNYFNIPEVSGKLGNLVLTFGVMF